MHYTSPQNDWLVQPYPQPTSVQETENNIILDKHTYLCYNIYYIIKTSTQSLQIVHSKKEKENK